MQNMENLKVQYEELDRSVSNLSLHVIDSDPLFYARISMELTNFLLNFYQAKNISWNGFSCLVKTEDVKELCDNFCSKFISICETLQNGENNAQLQSINSEMDTLLNSNLALYVEIPKQFYQKQTNDTTANGRERKASVSRKRKKDCGKLYNFLSGFCDHQPEVELFYKVFNDPNKSNEVKVTNDFVNGTLEFEILVEDIEKIRGTKSKVIEFANNYFLASCLIQPKWSSSVIKLSAASNPFFLYVNTSQNAKVQSVLFWYHLAAKKPLLFESGTTVPHESQSPEYICNRESVEWSKFKQHLSAFCEMETGKSLDMRKDRLLYVIKTRLLALKHDKDSPEQETIDFHTFAKRPIGGSKLSNSSRKTGKKRDISDTEMALQETNSSFWHWFNEHTKLLGKGSLVSKLWKHGYLWFGFDQVYTKHFMTNSLRLDRNVQQCMLIRFSINATKPSLVLCHLTADGDVDQWEPISVDALEKNDIFMMESINKVPCITSILRYVPGPTDFEISSMEEMDLICDISAGRQQCGGSVCERPGYTPLSKTCHPRAVSSTASTPRPSSPPAKKADTAGVVDLSALNISGHAQRGEFLAMLSQDTYVQCGCCAKKLVLIHNADGSHSVDLVNCETSIVTDAADRAVDMLNQMEGDGNGDVDLDRDSSFEMD